MDQVTHEIPPFLAMIHQDRGTWCAKANAALPEAHWENPVKTDDLRLPLFQETIKKPSKNHQKTIKKPSNHEIDSMRGILK